MNTWLIFSGVNILVSLVDYYYCLNKKNRLGGALLIGMLGGPIITFLSLLTIIIEELESRPK